MATPTSLHALIAQGEHQQQDFKYKITDAVKLARSVSAFANTDGGRLLIGVRDDGRIHGVQSEEEVYMMEAAANRYCQPESPIRFESVQAEGHNIVIATIPPTTKRPIFAIEPEDDSRATPHTPDKRIKKTAYVRVGDQNITASPVHLELWRQQQQTYGTTLHFTEAEQRLFEALRTDADLTLNRLSRISRLPRPKVITLLARLIRYGLVTMHYDEGNWYFR